MLIDIQRAVEKPIVGARIAGGCCGCSAQGFGVGVRRRDGFCRGWEGRCDGRGGFCADCDSRVCGFPGFGCAGCEGCVGGWGEGFDGYGGCGIVGYIVVFAELSTVGVSMGVCDAVV